MKKYLLIALISLSAVACSKDNSSRMATIPIKAVLEYSISGKTITFDASKSQNTNLAYGYQMETGPGTVTYSPSNSFRVRENTPFEWVQIKSTVSKAGIYSYRLTVYNTDGKEDFVVTQIEVK